MGEAPTQEALSQIGPKEFGIFCIEDCLYGKALNKEQTIEISRSDLSEDAFDKILIMLKNPEGDYVSLKYKIAQKKLRNCKLLCDYTGKGHPADTEKAAKHYLLAVEEGNFDAYSCVKNLLKKGLINVKKVEDSLLIAAGKCPDKAYHTLGSLFHHGVSGFGEKDNFLDFNKAENYYLRAVDAGYTYSYSSLAMLYKNGWKGHPADLEKAEEYYLLSIDASKSISKDSSIEHWEYLALAEMRKNNPHATLLEKKKSEKYYLAYYLPLAEKGDPWAYFNLASKCYDSQSDAVNAYKFYLKGAEAGGVASQLCYSSISYLHSFHWKDQPNAFGKAVYWKIEAAQPGPGKLDYSPQLRELLFPKTLHPIDKKLFTFPKCIQEISDKSTFVALNDEEQQWQNASSWLEHMA